MIISELIKELKKIQDEYGDIDSYYQAGYDWYNTDSINFDVHNQILYFK